MKKPPGKGHPIPNETKQDRPNLVHPAVYEIRVGRGYGVTIVPVVDLARLSVTAKTLHIVGLSGDSHSYKAICGQGGRPVQFFRESDAKAIVVSGQPVCVRCQDTLGPVPMPRLATEGAE